MNVKKIFLESVLVVFVCALLGLIVNGVRAQGVPLPPKDAKKAAADVESDTGPVDLAGAKKLYDDGAVFIDARSKDEFAKGHIKGALNFFYVDIKASRDKILAQVPLDKTVVTYCSGEECHASDMAANELLNMGYEKVRIFFAGWPAWVGAGYPTDASGAAEPVFKPLGIK